MHVEQEVRGGKETVLQHVLSADVERTMLLLEEKMIHHALNPTNAEGEPLPPLPHVKGMENIKISESTTVKNKRLTQIYARLEAIESSTGIHMYMCISCLINKIIYFLNSIS